MGGRDEAVGLVRDGPFDEASVEAMLVEHVAELSVTGREQALADDLEQRYRRAGETVVRVGDSLVVGQQGDRERPLVLLVGHLDVVPATDADDRPRRSDVDGHAVLVGRGTSDMKAGNVAAMAAFGDREARRASPYDLALVLYAREEGPADDNELADVLDAVEWLGRANLAVVLEPTDLEVHAGCLGGLHAQLTFRGRPAHSARPWHGENALTKAGAFLERLHRLEPRRVEVQGVAYHDVLSATQAATSNARNIIPGEFSLNLNFRFAPSRSCDEAQAELEAFVGGAADVVVVDRAVPAPPHLDAPLAERFVAVAQLPVAGKQAWTDVARFAALDVPALNFGPGMTAQAHQRGEHVRLSDLHAAVRILRRFIAPT